MKGDTWIARKQWTVWFRQKDLKFIDSFDLEVDGIIGTIQNVNGKWYNVMKKMFREAFQTIMESFTNGCNRNKMLTPQHFFYLCLLLNIEKCEKCCIMFSKREHLDKHAKLC